MENPPKRSLSLNLDLSDLFFGSSYPPTSHLIANQKKFNLPSYKSPMDSLSKDSYKMSHSMSMQDTTSDVGVPKKNLIQSMIGVFGSLTNIVSKIPNFMASMNQSLSVTVVPNEGIISSEYIVKNLTRSNEHTISNKGHSMKILDSMPKKSVSEKSYFGHIFAAELMATKKSMDVDNILSNTWIGSIQNHDDCFENFNSTGQANDLQLAIEESMRQIKYTKPIDEKVTTEMGKNILNVCTDDQVTMEVPLPINEKVMKLTDNTVKSESNNFDNGQTTELTDLASKKNIPKGWKKMNVIARSRGKGRGKLQLRRSGVSQSKHRKERIKHNIYSDIHDDIDAWEDREQASSFEELCNFATGASYSNDIDTVDFVTIHAVPESSMHLESFALATPRSSVKEKEPKFLQSPKQSPTDYTTVICDFRSRLTSDSSSDSEDSFSIVFDDGLESEYSDFDCESSSGDEYVNDDKPKDVKISSKIRFNPHPEIHTMIKWNYAYRAARRGPWEEMARDRKRFQDRISAMKSILDPILSKQCRERIYRDRFTENALMN